eukprot:4512592-Pleurochrysis_carterae.AAC.2
MTRTSRAPREYRRSCSTRRAPASGSGTCASPGSPAAAQAGARRRDTAAGLRARAVQSMQR